MANYNSLKATINANVKTNNNQEITGAVMNSVLNAMVNTLGAGYQFMGLATTTNPGSAQTPDYKCFYLATTPGTFTNLGGLVVADGEVALLKWDTSWTKEVTGIATAEQVSQLSLESKSNVLNSLLQLGSVPITESWLCGYISNGTTILAANQQYNSILIKADPDRTYTFSQAVVAYGLNELPRIGGSVAHTYALSNIFSNVQYPYLLVTIYLPMSTQYPNGLSLTQSGNVTDERIVPLENASNAAYSVTDLLGGATIRQGYYNGNTGAFVSSSEYSSFEASIDNQIDLNKFALRILNNASNNATQLVPNVIFYNGDAKIGIFYGERATPYIVQIPTGTTKVAINLLKNYTTDRGDVIDLYSTNVLASVAAALADLSPLKEEVALYSDYINVTKSTTANRIAVWLDEAATIQSNEYNVVVNFEHPSGLTRFYLYKATAAHGGLTSLGTFDINQVIKVEKDADKPVLYIYGSATETSVQAYDVNAVLYAINKDGISYKSSLVYDNTLANKNIVVFGDSLSEFIDPDGKSWSDHVMEFCNANIINVAIGGAQIRQRRALIPLFDPNESYSVGDKVFYKPAGATTMNYYTCSNPHTGAWDASDFTEANYATDVTMYANLDIINMVRACCDTSTPLSDRFALQIAAAQCIKDHRSDNNLAIVNRLSTIDWSTIDAVIIMGGTNDYGQGASVVGESGSTDINLTLGAINEAVRLLCSTYKISLHFVSPCVHWLNYSQGVGDDIYWCDNYIPGNQTMTRGQYYDLLISEFQNNHIPCLNLYKNMGWNKWNFKDYFWADGTHPTYGKGMFAMAEKIAAYLEANKAF